MKQKLTAVYGQLELGLASLTQPYNHLSAPNCPINCYYITVKMTKMQGNQTCAYMYIHTSMCVFRIVSSTS